MGTGTEAMKGAEAPANFTVHTGPDGWNVYTPITARKLAGIVNPDDFVDGLVKLARKDGGKAEIMERLVSLNGMARCEGEQERERIGIEQLKMAHSALDERVVCGFLAEVYTARQFHNGLPRGMVWNLNTLTLTKIVDALERAGYTPDGRTNGAGRIEKREALMGKSHNEARQPERSIGSFG